MKNKIEYLYILQANLSVLAYKVKNMHWHLWGESFFEVHEELDKLNEELTNLNDAVAEKIVMFDCLALGSYSEIIKKATIKEASGKLWKISEISETLSNDLNEILDFVGEQKEIDYRIQPLLDEIVLATHKWSWQLKSLNYRK